MQLCTSCIIHPKLLTRKTLIRNWKSQNLSVLVLGNNISIVYQKISNLSRCVLNLIRSNVLNWFYEMWELFVFDSICNIFGLRGCVRILHQLITLHQTHKIHFYAVTRSWHAHQKIRLDEFIWTKGIRFLFISNVLSYRQNHLETYSCGTFWKPHMCSYILMYLLLYLDIIALIF